jgi:hypothetical protein
VDVYEKRVSGGSVALVGETRIVPPNNPVKVAADRPYAEPEAAMRKILEIANAVDPAQDGSIHIEKINGPVLVPPCWEACYGNRQRAAYAPQ